jgi:hypothetical protein
MTLSELEARIGWPERNRLSEHCRCWEGDPRYTWSARKRGDWETPIGRSARARLRLSQAYLRYLINYRTVCT